MAHAVYSLPLCLFKVLLRWCFGSCTDSSEWKFRRGQSMEAGRRSVMAETGEEGRGRGVAANADRISFAGCDGNVLSSNSGDGCTTL